MRRMAVAVRRWTASSRVPGPLSAIMSPTTKASAVATRAARVTTTRHELAGGAVLACTACHTRRCGLVLHVSTECRAPPNLHPKSEPCGQSVHNARPDSGCSRRLLPPRTMASRHAAIGTVRSRIKCDAATHREEADGDLHESLLHSSMSVPEQCSGCSGPGRSTGCTIASQQERQGCTATVVALSRTQNVPCMAFRARDPARRCPMAAWRIPRHAAPAPDPASGRLDSSSRVVQPAQACHGSAAAR